MKNGIVRLSIILLIFALLLSGCKKNAVKTYDSIFDCDYAEEIKEHMHLPGVGLEIDDAELRLFNFPMLGSTAYCVVQYKNATDKISKIDCYMEFSAENILEQSIVVKEEFLKMIHYAQGEYGFYPIDEDLEVGQAEFLSGDASMEMNVYEDAISWNLSWIISGDVASLRLSKTIG